MGFEKKGVMFSSQSVLEHILAVNRAITFLSSFSPVSHNTRTQKNLYLRQLFEKIHREIFQDCFVQQGLMVPDYMLAEVFTEFTEVFYDRNGYIKPETRQQAAAVIARFYIGIKRLQPFGGRTYLTLRVFLIAMARSNGFRDKIGNFDFRVLGPRQRAVLLDEEGVSIENIETIFAAMLESKNYSYPVGKKSFFEWSDRSVIIHGQRFIQVNPEEFDKEGILFEDGKETREPLIVLIDGSLVPRAFFEQRFGEHMAAEGMLSHFVIDRGDIVGMLANLGVDTKGRSIARKTHIDGIDVAQTVPPICMDVNPLTLLSNYHHKRLENYLQALDYTPRDQSKHVTDLIDPKVVESARRGVLQDVAFTRILEQAIARIQVIVPLLEASVQEQLDKYIRGAALTASAQAEFVMTMGGSGSGKGSTPYFREHYVAEDGTIRSEYVYCSLDEGRPHSDIYYVLLAAGHHADDYEAVHGFASTRRDWLCDRAMKRGYNVLYDGSGVPYSQRYNHIVRRFKEAGYHTSVVAVDAPLYLPPSARGEGESDVVERVMARGGYAPDGSICQEHNANYRTLPWRIVVNKHAGFATSFIAAHEDSNLDELILIDNKGRRGEGQVIAKSFIVDQQVIDKLTTVNARDGLLEVLREGSYVSQNDDTSETDFLVATLGKDRYRLLVITAMARFAEVMQKGQINRHAYGPECLMEPSPNASFILPECDRF